MENVSDDLVFNHYALADPRIEDPVLRVRYIGRTKRTFRLRYKGHLKCVRDGGRTHRDHWLRQLIDLGLEPLMIDLGSGGDHREAELIAQWRALGADLTNGTLGGDGGRGYKWNDEQRANKSKVAREVASRPGWKEKIAETTRATHSLPEVQQRVKEGIRRHYEQPGALERKQEQQREVLARPEVRAKLYSPENQKKRADTMRALHEHGDLTEKLHEGRRKWLEDPVNRQAVADRMREYQARPEVKAAASQRTSEMNAQPENKARNARRARQMNADPEIIAKRKDTFEATYKARRAAHPQTAEIIRMIGEGVSQAEIARRLGLVYVTLDSRIRKLKKDGLL